MNNSYMLVLKAPACYINKEKLLTSLKTKVCDNFFNPIMYEFIIADTPNRDLNLCFFIINL